MAGDKRQQATGTELQQRVIRRAEARAEAAVAGALARAQQALSKADTRAEQILAANHQRMQDRVHRLQHRELTLGLPRGHDVGREPTDPAVPPTDAATLRRAIAERAYYKAERRGFYPGHQTDDWLQAEEELLEVFPYSNPYSKSESGGR